MTRICTLSSGSSGNCIFLSHNGTTVLIDCGITGRQAIACLQSIDADPCDIDFILVTHEHSDHTSGVGVMSRKFNIPIIASRGTWSGMSIGRIEHKNRFTFDGNKSFCIGEINVIPFDIPHDANLPTGYRFELGTKKVAVATDIGFVSESVINAVLGCDLVILEANHDRDMLVNGPYPYYLKKRIGGQHGHLCNDDAGELAASLVKSGTKEIILGHLSIENNSESIAFKTVERILGQSGIKTGRDVLMSVAPRYCAGKVAGL
ncbi:MAG: putative metallo-hydrolase YycJ [Firmicutes bacterium ADurb.Bin193]|nr:MAG: putative metallo-hydrolase YycJ [Firmicutes bacterium ADurb.Bin193]